MKISTPRAHRLAAHARDPQVLRNHMHDPLLRLDSAGHAHKDHRFSQDQVALEHRGPQHDVDEPCLVLEGQEDNPFGRTWPLPANDEPGAETGWELTGGTLRYKVG